MNLPSLSAVSFWSETVTAGETGREEKKIYQDCFSGKSEGNVFLAIWSQW